jgi:hypothetical protein
MPGRSISAMGSGSRASLEKGNWVKRPRLFRTGSCGLHGVPAIHSQEGKIRTKPNAKSHLTQIEVMLFHRQRYRTVDCGRKECN